MQGLQCSWGGCLSCPRPVFWPGPHTGVRQLFVAWRVLHGRGKKPPISGGKVGGKRRSGLPRCGSEGPGCPGHLWWQGSLWRQWNHTHSVLGTNRGGQRVSGNPNTQIHSRGRKGDGENNNVHITKIKRNRKLTKHTRKQGIIYRPLGGKGPASGGQKGCWLDPAGLVPPPPPPPIDPV